MLYILVGEDDFSLRQSLGKIRRGIGDQALLEANTIILEGRQVTPDRLRNACETVPFLAERRLVIVEGLLERFEPKDKYSRKKATNTPNQKDEYKSLAASVSNIPDSTVLVLIDKKIKSNNPLLKELSAKAKVESFPLPRNTKLRNWIQRRVAQEGGSISPGAIDLLARLVGSNLWIMSSEITKLVLFTSGRRIEEEDVKTLVSHAQEANVFAMVDAILESKASIAEQLLQQLLQAGASPAYLLVMLSRQVQMVVRAKELRKQRKSEAEIRDKLGLTSDFVLRKTLDQVDRYPWQRLKEVYHQILETDLSIKTGKYGGKLALNLLIAELCQKPQANLVQERSQAYT